MSITNAAHQAAAGAIAALGAYISLHSAAASTTGANEASGGGYARAQTTWTATGTGGDNGSQVNIPCAAGTYVEGGVWSAASAGTFVASAAFGGGSVVVSGTGASVNVTPSITA